MDAAFGIAVVTTTLCHVLEEALVGRSGGQVAAARVTTRRSSRGRPRAPNGPELAVELAAVTTSVERGPVDRLSRGAAGSPRPSTSLDLHYLVTATGEVGALEDQRLLGQAALALAGMPVLTSQALRAAVTAHRSELVDWPDAAAVVGADDEVVVMPAHLSPGELARLWRITGSEPVPALTYLARVVLS